jgi:hypothetical protein
MVYSTMPLSDKLAAELAYGAACSFSDWPNSIVPTFGAGSKSGMLRSGLGSDGRQRQASYGGATNVN